MVHASHTEPGKLRPIEWLRVNGRVNGLLDIGYHFVIFENGEIVETRDHRSQGSHASGYNSRYMGVCLIGGLRYRLGDDGELIEHHCDNFTAAQKEALGKLWRYLCGVYGKDLELLGHTELKRYKLRHSQLPCPPINMRKLRDDFSASKV